MLSLAGAEAGAVESSNAAWAVNRARPSFSESKPLMSSTSLASIRKVKPAMPGAKPDHVNLVLQIGRDQIVFSNAL
jgi:hypothetical protein